MTEFGKTLNRIMVNHDVYEWKDLLKLLDEKAGLDMGQPRLSGYLYGDKQPRRTQEFFNALAVALELDENEKKRLIYAYGYPKGGVGVSGETLQNAEAAEEEIRARKQNREREGNGAQRNSAGNN
ncbi:MAG: hypothetical protein ACRDSJ_10510 [Rubrobacteraceae bacterium]